LFFAGMGRLSENSVVSIKNKSFSVTAEVEMLAKSAEGVIIAQGGRFGGWSLYAKGQYPSTTCLASTNFQRGDRADPRASTGAMEFADGGGWARVASYALLTAKKWARAASLRRRR
jgi:hypothetical protein